MPAMTTDELMKLANAVYAGYSENSSLPSAHADTSSQFYISTTGDSSDYYYSPITTTTASPPGYTYYTNPAEPPPQRSKYLASINEERKDGRMTLQIDGNVYTFKTNKKLLKLSAALAELNLSYTIDQLYRLDRDGELVSCGEDAVVKPLTDDGPCEFYTADYLEYA